MMEMCVTHLLIVLLLVTAYLLILDSNQSPHSFVLVTKIIILDMFWCFLGEHIKIGTGRSGEGAGLLLQQAARGGAALPGAGRGECPFCRSANGGPLRFRRTGQSAAD